MTISTVNSGIRVEYNEYMRVYAKAPRGTGRWHFYLGDETDTHVYFGSFAQAKKQAVKDAKMAGYWKVRVAA